MDFLLGKPATRIWPHGQRDKGVGYSVDGAYE
jgi:hypothetical protein